MTKVLIAGAGLLASALLAAGQTAAPKIGIINIQAALVGTREGQAAVKDLESKSAPKKRDLEKLQGDINGMREKLNKMSSVGSDEQKQSMMRDIDTKTKSFNRQVEDAQAELDQEQGRILNELGGKMLAVLDKYAKDNAFTIIFDVSAQNTPVLFAANGIDVTQEVVALYDRNAPTPTSSAPATSGPVTPAASRPGATSPVRTTPAGRPAGSLAPATVAPKPGAVK